MNLFFIIPFLSFIFGSPAIAATQDPSIDWTVAIYAGIDEADVARHWGPIVEEIRQTILPGNIQLLVEQDESRVTGTKRFERTGSGEPTLTRLPEHDSANPETFRGFMDWIAERRQGKALIVVMATHSWGWRGIIQDFHIPGQPNVDTMMPLRNYAQVIRDAGQASEQAKIDILLMDACVLGNAEAIDEFRGIAKYLISSQKETPYAGFPYLPLFQDMGSMRIYPSNRGEIIERLARSMPERYVAAYSRDGILAHDEKEYSVVTASAIDLEKWETFANKFKNWVDLISAEGFRELLVANPHLPDASVDILDQNHDLIELLKRVPEWMNSERVTRETREFRQWIGYPESADRTSTDPIEIRNAESFELTIQGDELLPEEANEHDDPHEFLNPLETMKKHFVKDMNPDLPLPANLEFDLRETRHTRQLIVRGTPENDQPLRMRIWLPGAKEAHLRFVARNGQIRYADYTHERDYVSVRDFPDQSFMLSEAHSQGSPFIHGIGMSFKPLMDQTEEQAVDPITGVRGPDFYRTLQWNVHTGWGNLILLN